MQVQAQLSDETFIEFKLKRNITFCFENKEIGTVRTFGNNPQNIKLPKLEV